MGLWVYICATDGPVKQTERALAKIRGEGKKEEKEKKARGRGEQLSIKFNIRRSERNTL